ncbi:MAG: hypothetical protein J6866_03905, partial [Victivallales bacterium]|nr:hypothetical protein [Victivallales bacterium]
MRRYADWSLQTWPPRPVSEKLRTRWNLHGGIGHTQNTIAYSREWIMPSHEGQVIEFDSYWTLSDKAPWNPPWEESDAYYAERGQKPARRLHDPVTGKSLYAFNRGDYDGYNPQWGGLPAFRDLIDELRARDYVLTLYTDPIIACHNTKNGPELARKYGIINPDWRTFHHAANEPKPPIVHAYNSYCLDLNAEGYPEWIASTMGRLIRDTGADGIRLDEYGHRGYICFSDKHRHLFGEPGQNCWLTAVKHSIELVRAEFDKIDPTLIIMTEFPGHDAVASTLDGALSYNICRRYGTACPLPFNLFRQYFPNCKLYEINVQGPKNFYDLSIWNGAGTCYPIYPVPYLKLLSDHSDEFSGQAEMLVPTLKPGIYANKFTDLKTGKCVYTLYNHSGFTCHAPVLPAKPGCTYTCRDVSRNEPLPVLDGLLKVRIAPGRVVLVCEQPAKQ